MMAIRQAIACYSSIPTPRPRHHQPLTHRNKTSTEEALRITTEVLVELWSDNPPGHRMNAINHGDVWLANTQYSLNPISIM